MRPVDKIKNKPVKKKTVPAAKKESHTRAVPKAGGKKLKKTELPGKTEQHKKKESPPSKGKSPKKPVLPVPVKKQPKKGVLVGKAKTQSAKKDAPVSKATPSKRLAPPVAEKKQPRKGEPDGKENRQAGKKSAPAGKVKPAEAKAISFETGQLPEERAAVAEEEIQPRPRVVSPAVLGKRYKCYKCGIKFYDLGKPQPLCPSCGANQLDVVIKATRKRRGKQRSAFVAKTEPLNIAPEENENLHEVVDDLDSEYVLDMNDIVLEEHEDTEDKE